MSEHCNQWLNQKWVKTLMDQGLSQSEAIACLQGILMRGLGSVLRKRTEFESICGREQIEDFVQESLATIITKLDQFDGRSRFTTWCFTIATRVAFSRARRKRFSEVPLPEQVFEHREQLQGPVSESHENDIVDIHSIEWLMTVMDTHLSAGQSQALKATVLGEMPMEQVAEKLGTNRNALYKQVHDARKKLRSVLEDMGVTKEDLAPVSGGPRPGGRGL